MLGEFYDTGHGWKAGLLPIQDEQGEDQPGGDEDG
jgi:hypothetical protein